MTTRSGQRWSEMIDDSTAARTARLRQIAAVEIARRRDGPGYLGAALDGSLATGAVWPSSDLDFTIVPPRETSFETLLERERLGALPFPWRHPDGRLHVDVCGEQGGISWHEHVTEDQALLDLVRGYPESFMPPAEGSIDPSVNGFLDGIAVMEVVDDPEGLLRETRRFVAARRFSPEVWEGRRLALLQELRCRREQAHAALESGEPDAAYACLSGAGGFASLAARLWLEGARRLISGKEEDGQLLAVAREVGYPEIHALYRGVLAVEPERALAAAPLLVRLARRGPRLYRRLGALLPLDAPRRREATVWGAHLAHLAGTLGLAPGRGHPALLYPSLGALRLWAVDYPARWIAAHAPEPFPGREPLHRRVAEVAGLAERVHTLLLDPARACHRVRSCLAAADRLVGLTEARR